ncbi:MAG: hypothetical protein ACK459_08750, partial [Akkermansiaceae bacterium]
ITNGVGCSYFAACVIAQLKLKFRAWRRFSSAMPFGNKFVMALTKRRHVFSHPNVPPHRQ